MAEATGGQFLAFDAEGGIGSVADRILDQRVQYRVTFSSQANTAGSHSLQLQITDGDFETSSPPVEYEINVQPPEVAFIQPPNEIVRQTDDPELPVEQITPTTFELQILTTFPDGHARSIERSSLLVDDEVVDVRREEPFDRFEFDLSEYRRTGSHTLKVLVRDTLGLEAETIVNPVQIVISRPDQGLSALTPRFGLSGSGAGRDRGRDGANHRTHDARPKDTAP